MILICTKCHRPSTLVTFQDTALLILFSAFCQDERAESRWPIVCDDCWQKFRERFPATRKAKQ